MANEITVLETEGFENVKVDSFDNHATYLTGEFKGTKYEFKSHVGLFHDDTEVHGRHVGSEDWRFMFYIENEEVTV